MGAIWYFCCHWPDLYRWLTPLVQRSIHDEFVARLIEVAGQPKLEIRCSRYACRAGNHPATIPKGTDYLEIAKNEGANCVLGGNAYTGEGSKASNLLSRPSLPV